MLGSPTKKVYNVHRYLDMTHWNELVQRHLKMLIWENTNVANMNEMKNFDSFSAMYANKPLASAPQKLQVEMHAITHHT